MRSDYGVIEVGRVTSEVILANNEDVAMASRGALAPEKVRRVRATGIVDTGANHVVLPKTIADQLGLPIHGLATVRYADNRTSTRPIVKQLSLEVAGREGTFRAIVEPDRDSVLIGVLVLEDLDLIVDPGRETLIPRDPEHFTSVIE
jgi:predicted aspartyl protease